MEGWYGQEFDRPLARTREYIDIIRQVWAREAPVVSAGPHYPLPRNGIGSAGAGKPLRSIVHPLRADIPIMLGAEGPKNVALAAEVCDGWLPTFFSPRLAPMYDEWLDEGFSRPGARRSREDFEICATANLVVTDDRAAALAAMKSTLALHLGAMGAEEPNFHAHVYRRAGYSEVLDAVVQLLRAGRKGLAAQEIPDELVDDSAIVGSVDYVREQIGIWESAGVTMMVFSPRDVRQIHTIADMFR